MSALPPTSLVKVVALKNVPGLLKVGNRVLVLHYGGQNAES
jgi:hypothetical protein